MLLSCCSKAIDPLLHHTEPSTAHDAGVLCVARDCSAATVGDVPLYSGVVRDVQNLVTDIISLFDTSNVDGSPSPTYQARLQSAAIR